MKIKRIYPIYAKQIFPTKNKQKKVQKKYIEIYSKEEKMAGNLINILV